MGAWSTRIFDNDISMDILTEYKTMLGYKVSPEIAYAKIKDYFEKDFIGKDDEDDYWLALAYFQWRNGILIDEVKENALRCLEDEKYLERWAESGAKVLEKRKKTLAEFKYNLENVVNPTKESFPKCPAYLRAKTKYKIGDIILYKMIKTLYSYPDDDEAEKKAVERSEELCDKYFLLKVVDIHKTPVSTLCPELDYSSSPILMVYDWIGNTKPDVAIVSELKFKKLCCRILWKTIDFDKMEKLDTPYFEKRMCTAFELIDDDDFENGKKCEIEIIANESSTDINDIKLWLEHPKCIDSYRAFDYVLTYSFVDYDYIEVWN